MKLIVHTQYYENYSFTSNGDISVAKPYFKAKGGDDVEIATLTNEQQHDVEVINRFLKIAHELLCYNTVYNSMSIVGYSIIEDGEQTEMEKMTEGEIPRLYVPIPHE